jgi:hypothetical protein
MNLTGRLRKLERCRPGTGRRCRCANANAQRPVGVYSHDEPRPVVSDKVCARCGGILSAVIIHVVYDESPPLPSRATADLGLPAGRVVRTQKNPGEPGVEGDEP